MATAREYLEKSETGQLESLLTREAYGADKFNLSMIYLICAILSEREPRRGERRECVPGVCRPLCEHPGVCAAVID